MKKLIAILLSVLMLCSMIPFATVSAEGTPTIVAATVETAKAGDEIEVTVSLKNNPGIVAAKVEIEFDESVMELMTHEVYDEENDEYYDEAFIVMGQGWAKSKTTFNNAGRCLVVFSNGTARNDITKELFFTAHFKIKDDAAPGTYPLTVVHENKNMKNKAKQQIDFAAQSTTITIEGDKPACQHEYSAVCDADCNLCGEIREAAAHTYFDGCSPICDVCGAEREVSHNVKAVAAKAPTCTEIGNIAYWYCEVCGAAWLDEACTLNTNLMAVKLGATCSTNAVYTAAKAPTCYEPGNVEYWYCANCDVYYLDAACTVITNAKSVILGISHNLIHVEAVAANCTENGNIEHWYCADCGQAWLDELCHLNTNLKSVVVPASCSHNAVYTAAKAATCFEPGNVEYWYCANCDVYYLDAQCATITNAKSVILPITHNVIHAEAKAPTCTENGNIEHWYCADCGQAWLDELCHFNTNLKAVVLPAPGHTYDSADDAVCNVCGEIAEGVEYKIVTFSGSSVAEDKNGVSGLAFLFNVNVADIAIKEGTIKEAAYEGSSVIIDGVKYDVKGMGAMVSNNGQIATSLEENANLINIPAKWLYNLEAFSASYAVRVIGIPEIGYGVDVTAVPYVVYEVDGVEYIHFGATQVNSVNNALN